MGSGSQEALKQLRELVDQVEDPALQKTFKNLHQGYPDETLVRFLKARDWNVPKAYKMIVDCLNWRVQNEIDDILSKIITPELYRDIRDTQLIGLSGYSNTGLPVIAIGVGLSTYDKASVHYYLQSHIQLNEYRDRVVLPSASKSCGRHIGTCIKVLDMTGLKLSALSQIKILTNISTVDDLNYPEKSDTYFIVNAPYIFSACWKTVKPLLHDRTKRKIQVLQGNGRNELLKIMDESALPHFCKRDHTSSNGNSNYCYSSDHSFHQQFYAYMKLQATGVGPTLLPPLKQQSFHVNVPETPSPMKRQIVGILEDFKKMDVSDSSCSGRLANSNPTRSQHTT
ncbi:putative SEC14 cytosolic factor [Zostera marina]|uniref:Putative SEC14 cytosolic factor n=1 Tax=Zostera marina TaxID=29655 RepID=A0A0K9Q3V0_ZOSMR|nr:putative SEC14 cytosolic factor [Zostera marina]